MTEPEIRTHPPFLLAGIRRKLPFVDMARLIPEQWSAFMARPNLIGAVPGVTYGVIAGTNVQEGWCEYMTAMEVADLAAQPEGTGKMRVPEARYAVFTHVGSADGIYQVWEEAHRWLASSPYEDSSTPAFERYDERFDPSADSGLVEIWHPIQDRK